MVGSAIFEAIGVASLFPFMEVLNEPEILESNTFFKGLFSIVKVEDQTLKILTLGLTVFLTLIASGVIKMLSMYAQLRFVHMSGAHLTSKIFKLYLDQNFEWFARQNSAQLSKILHSEVQLVIGSGLFPFLVMTSNVFVILTIASVIVLTEPKVVLGTLFFVGLTYVLFFKFIKPLVDKLAAERNESNAQQFKIVSETFGGIKEIKLMNMEPRVTKDFSQQALLTGRSKYQSSSIKLLPKYVLELISFALMISLTMTLYISGGLKETLPIITLIAFAFYKLLPAIQQFYGAFVDSRFVMPAIDSVTEFLSLQQHPTFCHETQMRLIDGLVLEKVSYTYPNKKQETLSQLSCKINRGEFVAIVGETGKGKTTILNLASGLLKPTSGHIYVDGVELNELNVRQWYKSVAYVQQETFLFDGTVIENIALGDQSPDLDWIKKVADIACIREFIESELHDGYLSNVGERGTSLSGGQAQRISIARALYKKPSLLILDEATNALDEATQDKLLKNLNLLKDEGMTIILVSHRKEAISTTTRVIKI